MTIDTALTVLTWTIVTIAAAAIVCVFLLRRWAARLLVVGIALLLVICVFAARRQISELAADNPGVLCTDGGVSWFGVSLTGDDELCAKYR